MINQPVLVKKTEPHRSLWGSVFKSGADVYNGLD